MINVLFVCHGNICRSPMAEFMFKTLVKEKEKEEFFNIESAAVSNEETGNPVYPPARQILSLHGISCSGKRARRISEDDYMRFDYIIAMDRSNMRYLGRMLPSMDKTYLLMSFAGEACDVADPWYTGDFETCFEDIDAGCKAFYSFLLKTHKELSDV